MNALKTILATALTAGLAASAAHAGLIVTGTRTAGTTYDQLTFRLTGLTGADATYVPTGTFDAVNGVSLIQGTFTASSGATLSVPGTDTQYIIRTTNAFAGTPNDSYVNFDSVINSDFARTPSGSTTPTALKGTWYTTGDGSVDGTRLRIVDTSPTDGLDETIVAEMFVTHGADVSFNGVYSTYASITQPLSFTSATPEPASLGLLAAGSLLALRRRKA